MEHPTHGPAERAPAELVTGPRVTLRRRRPGDSAAVHRAVVDALPHLVPWMPWAVAGYDLATARAQGERAERAWADHTAFAYVLESGGELAGMLELRHQPGGIMELGYWLHPAHTGRGLVTEAAGLLVEQAFTLPGVAAVEIWHDAANTASAGVPRRLGFTEVARHTPPREPLSPGEIGVDVVWRLTRPRP
ncbi:GNAT family N-acetyltransferase [Pseudonocardia sp.]|uniref:GNAT family N-acetyltransferase n=1 Tax=Pseudonocardia sp. TaxID=60912 RepID=UPI003D0DBF1B